MAVELSEFEQPTDRRRERLTVILVGGVSKRLQGPVQEFVDHPIDGLKDFLVGLGIELLHRLLGKQSKQLRVANQVGLVPQSADRIARLPKVPIGQDFLDLFVDDFASFGKLLLAERFVALADRLQVVDRVEINAR